MNQRDELLREIDLEEGRLAALKTEVGESASRLAMLRERLAGERYGRSVMPAQAGPGATRVPMTAAERVALFRSLFRGRQDVFPLRWENRKNGRSGYSPACENE
jgi:hypothetical protein